MLRNIKCHKNNKINAKLKAQERLNFAVYDLLSKLSDTVIKFVEHHIICH
jgi:hypothetical protein